MRGHSDPQVKVVSEAEIGRLFNLFRYWERAQNGELRAEVIRESTPRVALIVNSAP